jgi:hypothetical protein
MCFEQGVRHFPGTLRGTKRVQVAGTDLRRHYHFTHDRLERNQNFIGLEKPANSAHRLILKVADKVDGVFMRVALVVSQLDDACDDEADFSELERKIDQAEPRAQDLFQQLLDSIHESDKDRSAQTFAFVPKLLGNKHGMRMCRLQNRGSKDCVLTD